MLKIVITLNQEEKGKIVREGILFVEQEGQGEVTQITATIKQERQAVLNAINEAFDKLEGLAEAKKAEKPITIKKPKTSKSKKGDDVEDWMKPAFSGQKLKYKGKK